jgi:hypothetical protein
VDRETRLCEAESTLECLGARKSDEFAIPIRENLAIVAIEVVSVRIRQIRQIRETIRVDIVRQALICKTVLTGTARVPGHPDEHHDRREHLPRHQTKHCSFTTRLTTL